MRQRCEAEAKRARERFYIMSWTAPEHSDGLCWKTSKWRYPNSKSAKKTLTHLKYYHRKGNKHVESRYYKCPWCEAYHLTSKEENIA